MKTVRADSAFSLIEISLALGIAAFTLLAIFGLLPAGLSTSQGAVAQTAALNITTAMVADFRQTPLGGTDSPIYHISVPTTSGSATIYLDEGGGLKLTSAAARYRATVLFVPPAAGNRTATFGSVSISWPAAATTTNALGSLTTFFALDRN